MQETNATQQEGPRPHERGATAHAVTEAALKNKVEALKELVLVLLCQIESLGESPALRGRLELDFSEEVHRFEAELLRNALIRTGGRQRQAARLLNMKLTTFHSKVKRYRLDSDELVKGASALRRDAKRLGPRGPGTTTARRGGPSHENSSFGRAEMEKSLGNRNSDSPS